MKKSPKRQPPQQPVREVPAPDLAKVIGGAAPANTTMQNDVNPQ